MLSCFWQWLQTASQGQAAFVGTLTGSSMGLVALLLGALFNAHLNRRRDDRLRREEQRAVATALRAELAGCRQALLSNSELLKKEGYLTPDMNFMTPDLVHAIRIMPHMIPKLGLLEQETIEKVANAYLAVEQHGDTLLLFRGRLVNPEGVSPARTGSRRLVSLSADKAPQVIAINNKTAEAIQNAIDRLSG